MRLFEGIRQSRALSMSDPRTGGVTQKPRKTVIAGSKATRQTHCASYLDKIASSLRSSQGHEASTAIPEFGCSSFICHSPPICMFFILNVGAVNPLFMSRSFPSISRPFSMSNAVPAMVSPFTGNTTFPFSIQNPEAPPLK